MPPTPRTPAGRHTLVWDLGAADGAAARWVRQAAAQGQRLVLAVREAGWQRDWMPLARELGVPVLASAADTSGLARTVRQALLPLGDRLDELVLVLDLPMPPEADPQRPVDWARSEVEACLQALQQGCIRLAELAHWCEPALRPGSQVRVMPLQLGHPALRGPGLDEALALSLSSTLRYLAHGLGPRGVQVDLLPPPPAAWPAPSPHPPHLAHHAQASGWSDGTGLLLGPSRDPAPAPARRLWRLGAAARAPAVSPVAPSTLPPPLSGAPRPSTLP